MTIEQLREAFSIYLNEIDLCEKSKCYWALLHILLTIPDICASLEDNFKETGDRYTNWCDKYIPKSTNISSNDRYQMRNSLFHSGSSTINNVGKKHQSSYVHFSYINPDVFDVTMHDTIDKPSNILNVHIKVMSMEIKQALESWFNALQKDITLMKKVEKNINFLSRLKLKQIDIKQTNGSILTIKGITSSSS